MKSVVNIVRYETSKDTDKSINDQIASEVDVPKGKFPNISGFRGKHMPKKFRGISSIYITALDDIKYPLENKFSSLIDRIRSALWDYER